MEEFKLDSEGLGNRIPTSRINGTAGVIDIKIPSMLQYIIPLQLGAVIVIGQG